MLIKFDVIKISDFLLNMVNRMKKILLLIALCVPSFVLADDDAYNASAEKLMTVMKLDDNFDMVAESLRPAMLSQYAQYIDVDNGDEALLAVNYSYIQREILADAFHSEDINNAIIDIYKELFSKEELDTLISFYMTPVGQKAIHAFPKLNDKLQPIMAIEMKEVSPSVKNLMVNFKAELEQLRNTQG